jgi:hypothetical protein
MSDLSFRAQTSGGDNSLTVSTVNAGAPTTVVGDLQVIWVGTGVASPGTPPTISTPSGWTLSGSSGTLAIASGAFNVKLHCFTKLALDADGTVTLNAGTNAAITWIRLSYPNPKASGYFQQVVFGTIASGTSLVVPQITTANARSLLSIGISLGAAQTVTPPGGTSERADNATFGISAHDEIKATAGATGTRTFTTSPATDAAYGFAEFISNIPTTTLVEGSLTSTVGISTPYTFGLNAPPNSPVTITPTHGVAGTWNPATLVVTNPADSGGVSWHTPSTTGSGVVSSTNDGSLSNASTGTVVVSAMPASGNTSDADQFILGSLGRGRGTFNSAFIKQRPNDAGPVIWSDFYFDATGGGTTFTITPSGGLVFAGGQSQLIRSRTANILGGVSFSGTTSLVRTRVGQVSGGINLTGATSLLRVRLFETSGGFSLSGNNNIIRIRLIPTSDGVIFGGTAAITFTPSAGGTTFTITPSGGIGFSNTNLVARDRIIQVSNGIAFSGSGIYTHTKQYGPSGGFLFTGTTIVGKTKIITPSGAILFSGTSSIQFTSAGGPNRLASFLMLTGVGQ